MQIARPAGPGSWVHEFCAGVAAWSGLPRRRLFTRSRQAAGNQKDRSQEQKRQLHLGGAVRRGCKNTRGGGNILRDRLRGGEDRGGPGRCPDHPGVQTHKQMHVLKKKVPS